MVTTDTYSLLLEKFARILVSSLKQYTYSNGHGHDAVNMEVYILDGTDAVLTYGTFFRPNEETINVCIDGKTKECLDIARAYTQPERCINMPNEDDKLIFKLVHAFSGKAYGYDKAYTIQDIEEIINGNGIVDGNWQQLDT